MAYISATIREKVRQRPEMRCEYCRLPEEYSYYRFQVDYIVAVKHGGSSEIDNLAWACFECNNAKGSDIASYDRPTWQLTPLFNPRIQSWSDHFTLDDVDIIGTTPVGRVTVYILQMNSPE